jgi:hypothetical protein
MFFYIKTALQCLHKVLKTLTRFEPTINLVETMTTTTLLSISLLPRLKLNKKPLLLRDRARLNIQNIVIVNLHSAFTCLKKFEISTICHSTFWALTKILQYSIVAYWHTYTYLGSWLGKHS